MLNPVLISRSALACTTLLLSMVLPASAQRTKKPAAAPTATADSAPAQDAKQPGTGRRRGGGSADSAGDKPEKTAYDYYLPGPDGKDVPVANFKDKYLLIVNLGRKSGYNDQLQALIKLYDTYKDRGLVVIGVPSNEFGAAEPGTEAEILKAYADAKVDFPIMQVSKLTGEDQLPFFNYLTKGKGAPAGGNVAWNYTKFIVDKKGAVIARFDPDVAPDSLEMLSTIDEILDGTYKPKKAPGGGRPGGEDAP